MDGHHSIYSHNVDIVVTFMRACISNWPNNSYCTMTAYSAVSDHIWHLTHWGQVMHISGSSLTNTDSDDGLALNQCWKIVKWTLRNKLQWNLKRYLYIFIQENAIENTIWKMVAILSRPQCVKHHIATNNKSLETSIQSPPHKPDAWHFADDNFILSILLRIFLYRSNFPDGPIQLIIFHQLDPYTDTLTQLASQSFHQGANEWTIPALILHQTTTELWSLWGQSTDTEIAVLN